MADPRHHFTMQKCFLIISQTYRLHTFFVRVKKTAQAIQKKVSYLVFWISTAGFTHLDKGIWSSWTSHPHRCWNKEESQYFFFSCPFSQNGKCVVYACKVCFPCVWLFWPVVTSIRGFSGLPWIQTVSSAKVQAGTVFSLNTDCPISWQDLPLCTVAPRLTLPLTILRVKIKLLSSAPEFFLFSKYNFLLKPVVMSKIGSQIWSDTHS